MEPRQSTRLARDYYVLVDANDYSVDPAVIGRTVEVAAGLEEVTVTCGGRQGPPPPVLGRPPEHHRSSSRSHSGAAAAGPPADHGPARGDGRAAAGAVGL